MAWIGPAGEPDRYELIELRSSGGEGQLWRGRLMVDGAPIVVAIKIIHASLHADLPEWRARWQRQAELLRSLDHPGLVRVRDLFEGPVPHEAGAADASTNTLVLVMNWVEGPSLPEWVVRHPDRDLLDTIRVLGRLTAAVDYLHSGAVTGSPVLHRDIKPANVIVTNAGAVLVDFGFTRVLSDQPLSMVGTPAYIAREVLDSNDHSAASDRYALGATAYFAITGEPPTPNDRQGMVAKLIASAGAEGRHDIADHVLSMMDPDPARRPTDAVGWAQQLAAAGVSNSALTSHRLTAPLPPPPPPAPQAAAPVVATVSEGRPRKRRTALIAACLVLLIGTIAAIAFVASNGADDTESASTEQPSTTESDVETSIAPAVQGSSAVEPTDTPTTDLAETTTTEETTTTLPKEVRIPDVAGESLDEAQRVLSDLGLESQVVEVEGPGPYGVVSDIDPAEGEDVLAGTSITLTLAKQPAQLPDVVGMTTAAATRELESYGVAVTATEAYAEGGTDDVVTAQVPTAGSPFATSVALTVNRRLAVTYLADLEWVDAQAVRPCCSDGPYVGEAATNGTKYTRSVYFTDAAHSYFSDPVVSGYVEYDLSRAYTNLVAVVGLRDDVRSDSVFKIEIFADGTPVFDATMGLGQQQDINIDMTNVLRLRLQVTYLTSNSLESENVVFGDIRLLGLP